MTTPGPSNTRRGFLKQSAAAGSAVAALSVPGNAHAAGTNETLRLGLIGCGNRGRGAAIDALMADADTRLVAVGDAFADRAEETLGILAQDEQVRDRLEVTPETTFAGFDNFKHVVDASDVVILATPPHFRPQHLRYAVESGKHCFVEKPVAVDAPGVKHVQETCQMAAKKGLSIVSGLCWRYDHAVRATMDKILGEQAIGDIVAIESKYNAGTLWHRGDKPDWSQMEYQIRNWLYYTWLSGDHIAEQAIHSLDKCAWLLGDEPPLTAMGIGGRQQRTGEKWGHIFDHFTVFYEFPNGKHVYFTCRQQDGTDTFVDERVLGTKGQAMVLRNTIHDNAGERVWRYRGERPSMYRVEHQEFFQSIRNGQPINNGDYMCRSTMIAIMGRMACYTGKTLTWDECISDTNRLGPSAYAWADVPEPPVAIPGRTKLGDIASTYGG